MNMAEDITTTETPPNVQLVVDERDMKSTFANGYRIYTTGEEVVIDFGFNMLNPNPGGGQQQMLFKATERLIVSYPTMKRLSLSLRQLVQQFEQRFGEIPTTPVSARK
jgi:hypothetical protein